MFFFFTSFIIAFKPLLNGANFWLKVVNTCLCFRSLFINLTLCKLVKKPPFILFTAAATAVTSGNKTFNTCVASKSKKKKVCARA